MQFQDRTLVPSLSSPRPIPHIPFGELPFVVQLALGEWDAPVVSIDGMPVVVPRRAGVSSFGVGGANAHLIVEEAPVVARVPEAVADCPGHVLALSGVSGAAVGRQVLRLQAFVESRAGGAVSDICFTANTGRRHLTHRAARGRRLVP